MNTVQASSSGAPEPSATGSFDPVSHAAR